MVKSAYFTRFGAQDFDTPVVETTGFLRTGLAWIWIQRLPMLSGLSTFVGFCITTASDSDRSHDERRHYAEPTTRTRFLKAADGVRLVVLPDGRGRMVDEIGLEDMENALPSL